MLPEAIYLTRKEGLKKLDEFSVVLIGCGLGYGVKEEGLLKKVLKKVSNKPLIIDADGLNLLAGMNVKLNQNVILTPHPLEASRLLGCPVEKVLEDADDFPAEYENHGVFTMVAKMVLARASVPEIMKALDSEKEFLSQREVGYFFHPSPEGKAANTLRNYTKNNKAR